MPVFNGRIEVDGKLVVMCRQRLREWMDKRRGLWVSLKIDLIGRGRCRDKKSREQLGYYWGLLVEEAKEELLRRGFTKTIEWGGIKNEIPIDKDDAHYILKKFCGYVGDDGKKIHVSEMNFNQMRIYIDYVLSWMISELGMNEKELKARRPK